MDWVAVLTMVFTGAGLLAIVPSALLYRHHRRQLQADAEKSSTEAAEALQRMALGFASRLEKQLDRAQKECELLTRQLEQARNEAARDSARHRREVDDLTSKLERAQKEATELAAQLERHQAELTEMTRELAAYRDRGPQGGGF